MLFFISLFFISFAKPWSLISPDRVKHDYPTQLEPTQWMIEKHEEFSIPPQTNIQKFLEQCVTTKEFLQQHPHAPLGILQHFGYTHAHRVKALTKIIHAGETNPKLLTQPSWWHTHFRHFVLHNQINKSDPTSIRLTKYVVYQVRGSEHKTEEYDHALWGVSENTSKSILQQYSRISILNGVLETKHHATPLVWLTKNDALEAQMQGTIEVELSKTSSKRFNVHRHNNMPYQKGVHAEKQLRYWYFRQVDSIYGWGEKEKVSIQEDVSFAGDVDNLGFGSMIWISDSEHAHLGLIVDTGGAFIPNLGQLDWFIGTVQDKEHFYEKATHYPKRAHVEFLLLRNP